MFENLPLVELAGLLHSPAGYAVVVSVERHLFYIVLVMCFHSGELFSFFMHVELAAIFFCSFFL